MALTHSTARRYAEAAFQIAQRDGSMAGWLGALATAEERLSDPEVARFLVNPAVAFDDRVRLLDRILGDAVEGPPRNLMALLVRRGRLDTLASVAREFRRMHNREEGIVEATVTSAVALDIGERDALQKRLAAMTERRVEMRLEVDPDLLGGIQVRLGDRLIDGSVRGRLERLRAKISSTAT